MDASGLETHQFAHWNSIRTRRKRRRDFKKFHVAGEARGPEKIIYSAEITKATRHDSPMLIPLLERINGDLGIVSGDKAYSCRKNTQYIADRNGTPRLVPRKNVTTRSKGCPAWWDMVNEYRENNDEWMDEYHQRSNSEAIFWSFKKRQGSYLFSKRWRNKTIEVHLKVIVYNLRLLIRRKARVALS